MPAYIQPGGAPPITCLSSVALIILKEVRIERGIHQALLADRINKTPSGWGKIESGKNSLGLDMLFNVCHALMISASAVIGSAERHATLLAQEGWCILNNNLEEEEDSLLTGAEAYYASPGFKRRSQNPFSFNTISALNSPVYTNGTIHVIDVIRFQVDPAFREGELFQL